MISYMRIENSQVADFNAESNVVTGEDVVVYDGEALSVRCALVMMYK